ncbi:hypothetical protein [Nonomuraea sp. NPDC049625]|uniref:hypothetical protein n=1 Tax=Nonomuraea sp. NPDC049625 TaxID=3155775 RepID=UPI00342091CE
MSDCKDTYSNVGSTQAGGVADWRFAALEAGERPVSFDVPEADASIADCTWLPIRFDGRTPAIASAGRVSPAVLMFSSRWATFA